MSGTLAGGRKSAQTNKRLYGNDFYRKIGKTGGTLGRTGGFGQGEVGKARARIAGAKGGRTSRRPKYIEDNPMNTTEEVRLSRMQKLFRRIGK